MILAAGLYLLGVVIGLARIDGRAPARIGVALAWPLGPAAFVATVATLLVASLIAFPLFGGAIAAVAAGWILLH